MDLIYIRKISDCFIRIEVRLSVYNIHIGLYMQSWTLSRGNAVYSYSLNGI